MGASRWHSWRRDGFDGPELINQLTPNGRLPADHADVISKGLAMLTGRLG